MPFCCSDRDELQDATLNEGLREIGMGVFIACFEFHEIIILTTVETVGAQAFEQEEDDEERFGCHGLTEVHFTEPSFLKSHDAIKFESIGRTGLCFL